MFDPKSVKVQGPLAPYMDGFWSELMRQGYSTLSGEKLFRVACQISRWLKQRRRGTHELTDDCVAQFTAHRRRQGRKEFVKPHAVEPFLSYLRKLGVAPPPVAPSETPVDRFVREYTDHLARQRGLTATTLCGYGGFARRFITGQPRANRLKWERLEPADITGFVLREARRSCVGQAKQVVTQLRSLLRYVHFTGLRVQDCVFGTGAHVRCHGKGRKERCTPLGRETVAVLRAWLKENDAAAADLVFASRRGTRLSSDAVEHLLAKHLEIANRTAPTLARKHVTPHTLRHTTAVHLLEAGVDRSIIALWLGHESVETTQIYLDADLALKERALARTAPPHVGRQRFRPKDSLLAFLESL